MVSGMSEISEEEFNRMKNFKEEEILEVSEKVFREFDFDRIERLRDRRRRLWEWKKKRDEYFRELFEGKVIDFLRRKSNREVMKWFREWCKENKWKIKKGMFKKLKVVKKDSWGWEVEIVGVMKNGMKKVLCRRVVISFKKYKK